MTEQIEQKVNEELAKVEARHAEVKARVDQLNLLHEDAVVIHRLGMETQSFLAQIESIQTSRMRTSWYGKVVRVSDVDCGDSIREAKKKKLAPGDFVIFNPDAAYSLNVANFAEIWLLHVDSVIAIDNGFDYMETMKENARKKAEVEAVMEKRKEEEARAKREVHDTLKRIQVASAIRSKGQNSPFAK